MTHPKIRTTYTHLLAFKTRKMIKITNGKDTQILYCVCLVIFLSLSVIIFQLLYQG